MNKEVRKMLKEAGVWKRFVIMLMLRSPFDILNSIISANLMASFIGIIEEGQKDKLLLNFLIFLLFITLLFAYNMTIWSTIATKTTVLLQKNLKIKVFDGITNLPYDILFDSFGADWVTRLNNDIDKACGYIMSPLNYMHMVIALVNVFISSIIMLFMNVELYIIGIFWVMAAFTINILLVSGKITEYSAIKQKNLVEYTELINVSAKDGEIISIFDGEDFIYQKIEDKSRDILKENMRIHNRLALCNMIYSFSGMIGYLMILVKGNDIMESEYWNFAKLCKMTQYRSNSVMSVNCIYNCIGNMKASIVGVKRVNEVLFREKTNG